MAVLLGILVAVGFLLTRYRDRLNKAFGPTKSAIRSSVDLAPGVKLIVAEVDGMKVVCGVNKAGISALQIVGPADKEQA